MKESSIENKTKIFYGGHSDEINCLVLSEDLEILLTASIDGCIRLWNTVYEHLTCKIDENQGSIILIFVTTKYRYDIIVKDLFGHWRFRKTIDILHRLQTIIKFVSIKQEHALYYLY